MLHFCEIETKPFSPTEKTAKPRALIIMGDSLCLHHLFLDFPVKLQCCLNISILLAPCHNFTVKTLHSHISVLLDCHMSFRKRLFKGAGSFAWIKSVTAVKRKMLGSGHCHLFMWVCSSGACWSYPAPELDLSMDPENIVLDNCQLHMSPVRAAHHGDSTSRELQSKYVYMCDQWLHTYQHTTAADKSKRERKQNRAKTTVSPIPFALCLSW